MGKGKRLRDRLRATARLRRAERQVATGPGGIPFVKGAEVLNIQYRYDRSSGRPAANATLCDESGENGREAFKVMCDTWAEVIEEVLSTTTREYGDRPLTLNHLADDEAVLGEVVGAMRAREDFQERGRVQ